MEDNTTTTTTKRSRDSSSEFENMIDELPECLLVEILCRLPRNAIVQCKCVSPFWSNLISKPSFHTHYSSLQNQQNPETTLMLVSTDGLTTESFTARLEETEVSRVLKLHEPHHTYMVVAGTCNDLVLWCTSTLMSLFYVKCYYITNPYTNHRYALPLPPQSHQAHLFAGIVCDSEHRFKVIRVVQCADGSASLEVQIFTSESRQWTQEVVPIPQGLTFEDMRSCVNSAGIVCNGRLYWLLSNYHVLVLDTSIQATSNFRISLVSKPGELAGFSGATTSRERCLAVFRGQLRLLMFDNGPPSTIFYVWNLKQNNDDDLQWCLRGKHTLHGTSATTYWKPLAMHPNVEKIFYTLCYDTHINPRRSYICTCTLRKNEPNYKPFMVKDRIPLQNRVAAFPLLYPTVRMPTPLPRQDAASHVPVHYRAWFPPQQQFITTLSFYF